MIAAGLGGAGLVAVLAGFFAFVSGHLTRWSALVLAGGVSRLAFFVVLAATMMLMDVQEIFYGLPLGLAIAVGLALVSIFFDAAGLVARLMAGWGGPIGLTGTAVYFSSTAVFVWWLSYWNILGWQVG